MAYSLKNIAVLSTKGATFRCVLMGISRNEGLKRLNNSVTYNKGVLGKKSFFLVYIKMSEITVLTYYKKNLKRNTK